MATPEDDRSRVVSMASRKGWEITTRGRDVILRKGHRTVTAKFDGDWNLVLFLAGAHPGRGGIDGILRLLGRV